MIAGRGDQLPVSALPVDGTYPSGTAAYEKRNISELVAVWDADLCIQCGNCSFVCPHSVIRSRFYPGEKLASAPAGFPSARSAPIPTALLIEPENGVPASVTPRCSGYGTFEASRRYARIIVGT